MTIIKPLREPREDLCPSKAHETTSCMCRQPPETPVGMAKEEPDDARLQVGAGARQCRKVNIANGEPWAIEPRFQSVANRRVVIRPSKS